MLGLSQMEEPSNFYHLQRAPVFDARQLPKKGMGINRDLFCSLIKAFKAEWDVCRMNGNQT